METRTNVLGRPVGENSGEAAGTRWRSGAAVALVAEGLGTLVSIRGLHEAYMALLSKGADQRL